MEVGIELNLVSKDKDDKTVFQKECIDTNDVLSFRPWKKGPRDKNVEGEMTLVLIKPKPWDKDPARPRQALLTMSYDEFAQLMRSNGVVIKSA